MVSLKNPYQGVNAHLNSLLQPAGTDEQPSLWPGFHTAYIINLVQEINSQLPANYMAIGEHSLQSRAESDEGSVSISLPQPDVTVFQQGSGAALAEKVEIEPSWQTAIDEALDPEDRMTAVVVRKLTGQTTIGVPVLRIELLSPSNKFGGRHYSAYRSRRNEAIESNVPLVEIDYLHESVSPIVGLPHYPDAEKSYPYYIAIHDNRPTWQEGLTSAYGFSIGQAIPELLLPLDGDNNFLFNFNPVYQQTFELGRWGQLINMSELPARFETYRADDQNEIRSIVSTMQKGD
jgi:hypothetical protein